MRTNMGHPGAWSRCARWIGIVLASCGLWLGSGPGRAAESNATPARVTNWMDDWMSFGPIASEKDPARFRPWFEPRKAPLALDGLTSIPQTIRIDGVTELRKNFRFEGEPVDFQQLWHTNDGQGIVYFFRIERAEAPALMNIVCESQGWLKWWVNGEPVYSHGGEELMTHRVSLPLRPGENVIGLRLSAARSGWRLQLKRQEKLEPLPALNSGVQAGWRGEGFQQFTAQPALVSAAAPEFRRARALQETAPADPDRLIKAEFKPMNATGHPAEFFIQVKDGCELGFTSYYDPAKDEYTVVWQMRVDGRSVWEVEHKPVRDWAGPSPLGSFRQTQGELALTRMDLDGLRNRAVETSATVFIAASRGDELTLRVSGMDALVLRHRVEGLGRRGGPAGFVMQGMAADVINFKAETMPAELKARWALSDKPPIEWAFRRPDMFKPAAGFPVLEGTRPITLYRAQPDGWTFCHHAKIAHAAGKLFASWSNSYMHEDSAGTRVAGAVSADGEQWSESFIIFPALSDPANEMAQPRKPGISIHPHGLAGFLAVGERVYALGSVAGRGIQYPGEFRLEARGIIARQVEGPGKMGPIFWLAEQAPAQASQIPTYAQLGDVTRTDAEEMMKRLNMKPSAEAKASFVNYVRGEVPEAADHSIIGHDPVYRCPDGAEMRVWRNYNGTHRLYVSMREKSGDPWGLAVPTEFPDSPSGVAVGNLPDGRVFIIGNQVGGEPDDADARPYRDPRKTWPFIERDFQPEHFPRDPLTLALSADGRKFDKIWALRHDCPNARYNGLGWLPGFQYPDVAVVDGAFWVVYSVNKEDVEVMKVPFDLLR